MRRATQDDIGTLVAIGACIAAEAKPFPHPFNGEATAGWLAALLTQSDVACFIEDGPESFPIGAVLGGLRTNAYAPRERELIIEYIWVHPDHRKGRTALRLWSAVTWWAQNHHACDAYFSGTTGASLDGLARLVGAVEVGKTYRKHLNGSGRPS